MGDDDNDDAREPPGTYTLTTDAGDKKCSIGYSGKGKAVYPNGDTYEGLFDNGVRQGRGIYTYFNGDVFDGTFEDNLKSGLGRIKYKKGGFYHGHFKDGKRDGEGTFQYANGDIYSGYWKDGQRDGDGTYVFAKTKYSFKGTWKDGQIIQGEWSMSDGTKFVGAFRNQKPCGDGVWHTAKGTVIEGAYVQQTVPRDGAPLAEPGQPPATVTRLFWKTAALVATED